ncbi:MAG: polysaccharide deacetylase family protein [Calditrichaeota bacterium]|nr:polysaccharide deacetylase family protein [Calditrichota bacterium]
MRTRSTVLRGLLGISYRFGGPFIWDIVRGGRVKILIYHSIPNQRRFEGIANHYGYSIPAQDFEQQLIYLSRHCNVIRVRDLLTDNSALSSTKTNVIITFDDGYENHYLNAYKLLERYTLPATFALPTAFVCNNEPLWDDIIEYAVVHCTKSRVRLQWEDEDREFVLADFSGRLELYNWLMRKTVQVDQMRRDELIGLALEELGASAEPENLFEDENYRPLNKNQIRKMAKSNLVEFASHSVHHYFLSRCGIEEKRMELRESKSQIEELTELPCTLFCVPGGAYDSEALEEAFSAGYECVLTSDSGTASHGNRVLNRNGIYNHYDIHKFADIVHGPVLEMLEVTRRARGAVRALFN